MKKIILLLAICAAALLSVYYSNAQGKRRLSKPASEWKKVLTPNQYYIMVESGTEPPYKNEYWNNHEKGVYVSAATGEVLFISDDKYDSQTGWPSFVKPFDPKKIAIVSDNSLGMSRDEVIEKSTGLHLGHVFDDGPVDRGGKRFCMNSGALKFIKK
ncbi:MAG TPA: peptide-methionine (R)-S-oxide reductase MsrB [Mucilaginibacter sp.]|nr:peptide-methionine (R)-S-oxide reductase MsrB [Mucilaginibacter sp.]